MRKVLLYTIGIAFTVACSQVACSTKKTHDDAQVTDETVMLQTTQRVHRSGAVQSDQLGNTAHAVGNETVAQSPRTLDASPRALLNARKSLSPGEIENTNICFVKIAKTGSTTGAGATRRVAAHHNLNGVNGRDWISDVGEPGIYTEHQALNVDVFGENPTVEPIHTDWNYLSKINALKMPSFLWTIVREPASRAHSQYYMKADTNDWNETTEEKLEWFAKYGGDEEFRFMRASSEDTVEDMIDLYGFIAVLERFDESMVVLAATLGVPVTDVMVINSKNSSAGFEYDSPGPDGTWVTSFHPPHPDIEDEPEAVQALLKEKFQTDDSLDHLLYKLVNKTLDEKIAKMQLQPVIDRYKKLKAEADQECGFNTTEERELIKKGECYSPEEGCNFECLDKYNERGEEMCEWCD